MPKTSPRRALIVIDVQNEYVSGRLRIEFPPLEDSLRHIADAMAVATSNGIPIVTVQQTAPPDAPLFAQGSEGWQLHAVMAGQDADHRVEKTLPSALRGTNLEAWLRERDIDWRANPLHDSDTATIVRVREGKPSFTDGPFAETREQLGGYYLVDVESRDQALELATLLPASSYGAVEVREVFDIGQDPKLQEG